MGRVRPRILIADEQTLVAQAYKGILEPEYEVVATVSDGHALLNETLRLHPQVVLLDISLSLLNGLDACLQLKHKLPDVKIIFVTMNADADLVADAFRRGASGYVPKTSGASELLSAIREVLSGRTYLSPAAAEDTIRALLAHQKPDGEDGDNLTDRQREVIQLLAEGKSMKEAAVILEMTPRTVAFHKYRIMKKLHLHNSAELVHYAMRHHIIAA
jgi:DNA-binding NarL/FixJ family response regulator